MLASTVQFSKNERTPSLPCHRLASDSRLAGSVAVRARIIFFAERNTVRVLSGPNSVPTTNIQALPGPFHVRKRTVLTPVTTRRIAYSQHPHL
jgi:hypothetical protein